MRILSLPLLHPHRDIRGRIDRRRADTSRRSFLPTGGRTAATSRAILCPSLYTVVDPHRRTRRRRRRHSAKMLITLVRDSVMQCFCHSCKAPMSLVGEFLPRRSMLPFAYIYIHIYLVAVVARPLLEDNNWRVLCARVVCCKRSREGGK